MLETLAARLSYIASVVFGLPLSAGSLDRMVDVLLATHHEFGTVERDGAELMAGPALDEQTRREVQLRRFPAQATQAAREMSYDARTAAQVGLEPARIRYDDIQRIPLTHKRRCATTPTPSSAAPRRRSSVPPHGSIFRLNHVECVSYIMYARSRG